MNRGKIWMLIPLFLLVAFIAESNRHAAAPTPAAPLPAASTSLPAADPDSTPVPVVVELFTSEGCSSCPPADAFLKDLAASGQVGAARIIPLAFHVDYWDRLGWRDPFSSAQATERQKNYAHSMNLRSLYTPQMVVGGQREFIGSNRAKGVEALRAAAADATQVELKIAMSDPDEWTVHIEPREGFTPGAYDVMLAITESGLATDIPRGENRGLRLEHAAVVRTLKRIDTVELGGGRGAAAKELALEFELDGGWSKAHCQVVVFVQAAGQGRIVGAAARGL